MVQCVMNFKHPVFSNLVISVLVVVPKFDLHVPEPPNSNSVKIPHHIEYNQSAIHAEPPGRPFQEGGTISISTTNACEEDQKAMMT